MTPPEGATVRFMEPRVRPIARATDLGSVQVLKHGNVYLLTDQFGDIHPDSRGLGLYRTDTRLLSCSVLHVGGERPVLLQGSMGGNYRGAIQLTNPSADRNPDMKVHPLDDLVGRTIGISRDRLIGGGALEELVRIVNHADRAVTITVELDMGADDADIFEVRGYPRPARGTLLPVAVTPERITFRYDGLDGVRRSTYLAFSQPATEIGEVAAMPADPLDTGATVRLRWSLALEPRAAGELRWTVWADDGPRAPGRRRRARCGDALPGAAARLGRRGRRGLPGLGPRHHDGRQRPRDLRPRRWSAPSTTCGCSSTTARARTSATSRPACRGSRRCSAATRSSPRSSRSRSGRRSRSRRCPCWRPTRPPRSTTAATPSPARSSTSCGPGRWPGAGELPHTPYYGSVDSTPLWLILLGETFDWTGDRALLDRLWPNALAALEWIDTYGDRDGDGFVEYERRSERGLLNQGWKDSSDAIRDRAGVEAVPPIALAEVQGYVFDAKRRMAGLARVRGDDELATRLDADAETLQRALRSRVLDRGQALLRARARPRQAPGRRDRLERRPVPVDGDREPGAGGGRGRAAARPG